MKLPMCSSWSKLFNFMSLSPKYAQTTPCSAQITLVTFSASLSSIVEPIAICFAHASCTSPFSASLMLLDLALVIGPLGIFKGSFEVGLSSCWISSKPVKHVTVTREEILVEINSYVPQFSLVKGPILIILFQPINSVSPPPQNGGGMEEFTVPVSPLQPVTSRFLVPQKFFLSKKLIILFP